MHGKIYIGPQQKQGVGWRAHGDHVAFTHRTPEAFGKDCMTCLPFGFAMDADSQCTFTVASVDKLGAGAALPVHSCSGVAALHHDEQQ